VVVSDIHKYLARLAEAPAEEGSPLAAMQAVAAVS
jgi:hypothetical protein